MIYTVTLNPAIDYFISTSCVEKGQLNNYSFEEYSAGGKGINVSRLLTSFGLQNTSLGFVRGFSGMEIVEQLKKENCHTDFVMLPNGHSRINIKICESGGNETDLNGIGFPLPSDTVAQLIKKLDKAIKGDILVLAGSLPTGADENIYADLLHWATNLGMECVVDAVRDSLINALPYRPFLIKPNHWELGELFNVKISSLDMAKFYGGKLQESGARNVVVSLGKKGALFISESGQSTFYPAAFGNTISTVGSGDSMIAGILYGLQIEKNWNTAMQWGICAGAATAFKKGIASADEVINIFQKEFS